jgi:diguanylate cyclase (GGDEF)-like protein
VIAFIRKLNSSSVNAAAFSLVGLVVIFTMLLAFSLWKTTHATDETDIARTQAAVEAIVHNELTKLVGVNTDNAYWDDAYIATAGKEVDQDFISSTWGAPTGPNMDNQMYDMSAVLDRRGHLRTAWSHGKKTDFAETPEYIVILRRLASRISDKSQDIVSVEPTSRGPRIFSVSVIKPLSDGLKTKAKIGEASLLAMSYPVSHDMLAKIAGLLQLKGVRLAKPGDPFAATVDSLDGIPAVSITWIPASPGANSVSKVAPVLGIGLAVCLLLASVVMRFAIRLLRNLRAQALSDMLSQLPNRRAIQLRLSEEVAAKKSVALAFIDLDGFKSINDNYGHGVGDALIRQCAELITALSPNCAMVARLGGDEFAIVATGADAAAIAEDVAARFIERLRQPFLLGDRTVTIGASIGLATCPDGQAGAAELMRRADFAMYSAKTNGKMQLTWFSPELDKKQAAQHQIEMRIRKQLNDRAFGLEYQPIVDAKSHRIHGVEALIRWGADDALALAPDDFIPVAEETGLIDAIGGFVLERACTEALDWHGIALCVNVSPAQLRNPRFPDIVADVLEKTGFPADRLELEVTETYVITNPDFARQQFDALRALGVKIALDDFGTGYASIGYLRQFRFDKLKIDRSLVAEALNDEASRALLNASIFIAHSLDMTVVAEGVETLAQAQLMNVAGSDLLQGWHFSRSMTGVNFGAVIDPDNAAVMIGDGIDYAPKLPGREAA